MPSSSLAARSRRAVAVREAIADLTAQSPPARELLDVVQRRLRTVVPFDGGGWWTSDPETILPTELWEFDYSALVQEVLADDVNQLAVLDRLGRTVASLGQETGGDKTRSARFVTDRAPAGLGDELRVLARSGNSSWGSACLSRAADAPDFTPHELTLVADVARDVGHALRADLLRVAEDGHLHHSAEGGGGSGTVLLGPEDRIEGSTPQAMQWLVRLGASRDSRELPSALRWVALQARAGAQSPTRGHRRAQTRMTTPDGELVFVRAEVLEGTSSPSVVMTLEPGTPATMNPLLMTLYGLTEREREVTALLLAGWPLADVARSLLLSVHTVRDHVKAVYAKVGVRTRPELTARLGNGAAHASRSAPRVVA